MNSSLLKENNPLMIIQCRMKEEMTETGDKKSDIQDVNTYKLDKIIIGNKRMYRTDPEITYIDHYEKMYGFSFNKYTRIAEKILSDTQIEYRYLISKIKLLYPNTILTESELKNYFLSSRPALSCDENKLGEITNTLLGGKDNIKVKYFDQENGNISTFCVPIRIPDHICILTDRIQTAYELKPLLHELGHAVSLSCTFQKISLLRTYLYNEVMQEAYADLYENLLIYNSDFQENYQIELSQEEMENCRLEELYQTRLQAAKMIYLMEYYSNDNEKYLRSLYQEIMQNSLLININSSVYANDTVTGFVNIRNYIGKIIAAKIQNYLEGSFGLEWYRRNTASEALKKLFSYGGLVTPDNFEKFLTT